MVTVSASFDDGRDDVSSDGREAPSRVRRNVLRSNRCSEL